MADEKACGAIIFTDAAMNVLQYEETKRELTEAEQYLRKMEPCMRVQVPSPDLFSENERGYRDDRIKGDYI